MKITVVGAGAVGASCAEYIAIKNFASEVVLLDIKEGFAEGKAMDLMQTASLNNFDIKEIMRKIDDNDEIPLTENNSEIGIPELIKLYYDVYDEEKKEFTSMSELMKKILSLLTIVFSFYAFEQEKYDTK